MVVGFIIGSILGLLIVNVIIGFLTQNLHALKGYDGGFLVGLFLGFIGLVYSIGLPDASVKKITQDQNGTAIIESVEDNPEEESQEYILCPKCGYPIYEDENHCSNCGEKNIR